MRYAALAGTAIVATVGAQLLRDHVTAQRTAWPDEANVPYAPSAGAAPYVTLGYRELGADLMWMRTLAYLGGTTDTADGIRSLVEATLALDPWFKSGYSGALAIESASHGVNNAAHLAAVTVLERGMARYPGEWRYPYQIGQIYVADLITTDPAERRAWNELGVAMLERTVRMKGTPAEVVALAASLHKALGRREAAIRVLRDKIALTTDPGAQQLLFKDLAELENRDSAELAIAMIEEREGFRREWFAARPTLPALMYVVLGPRRDPYLPPAALAVDRDLIGTRVEEPVEPLVDPPEPDPTPAP